MDQTVHKCLRFDRFVLDLTRGALRTCDGDIALSPKAYGVLRHLAENAGRLVPKQELYEAVWPNVLVSNDSLVQCVRELRQKLGDDEHCLIKTVSRRGYLFDVQISVDLVTPPRPPLATALTELRPALPLPERPSIAVLPFTNLSGDSAQEYLADGIVEDIITELSRFSELFVIARNSSFRYKGKSPDVRQVGHELGVRYVLEGSVRRDGDRLRISAQLIDAASGGHRWAERYDRKLEGVFALQGEVAQTIAAVLVAHLRRAETERARAKPPNSWQAYDYYLQAADAFSGFTSSFNMEQLYETRRLAQQSLAVDANYSRSQAILATANAIVAAADGASWVNGQKSDFPNPSLLEHAYQHARKAVHLDPNLPEAHACFGYVLMWKRQHDASIAAFERAIALNSNYVDWRFGAALIFAGEPRRAVDVLETYMRLDPFYVPIGAGMLGWAYYMLKQYTQALPMLRDCVSRMPNFRSGHIFLASTYAQMGRLEEARAEAAEVLRITPEWTIGISVRLTGLKHPHDVKHYVDGLRKAGLPEG